MATKLTPEQREALHHCDGPVLVEDETNRRRYFLIEASALEAMQRQQDIAALREGIADMEAGRVAPLDEVIARIRATLGLPQAQ